MSRKLYINLLYGMGYGSGMVEQGSEDNPENGNSYLADARFQAALNNQAG